MVRLDRTGCARLLPYAVVIVLALAALAMLPSGVCQHDCADIQMAATTLGIAHPPGYALVSLVGHVFARCVPDNPAYGVSLMNWATGVMLLLLTVCILRRLHVRASLIVATAALLPCHRLFWNLWCIPEVYMPVLAVLALGVYAILRWREAHCLAWLATAAFCFGFAAGTRTTMWLYLLPALAAIVLPRSHGTDASESSRPQRKRVPWIGLALGILCFLLPILTSLSYIWLRDVPSNRYNYLSQMSAGTELFEPNQFDPTTKQNRLIWLVTARQYWHWLRPAPREIWHRATRAVTETSSPDMFLMLLLLALAAGGSVALFKRDRGLPILLIGLFLANLAFLSAYTVQDAAEMSLPLVWSLAILAACGLDATLSRLSRELAPRRLDPAPKTGAFVAIAATLFSMGLSGHRLQAGPGDWSYPPDLDVDWAALPKDARICSDWTEYPPLSYQAMIEARRPDIHVLAPPPEDPWPDIVKRTQHPVYYTRSAACPRGWQTTPEHGLLRVRPEKTP